MNNYMTAEYMSSILQQYHQSPTKTADQNITYLVQNEEQVRRRLNESLFRTIDDSFERQIKQMTAVKRPPVSETPNRVQQMVRNPVITSDSFGPIRTADLFSRGTPKASTNASNSVTAIRAQYSGDSFAVPRSRPLANIYKAKVIDYSNGIIERPQVIDYTHRPQVAPQSVLTERNTDPMLIQSRTAQNFNALHSVTPNKPMAPKPILKNAIPKTNPQLQNPQKPFISLTSNTSTPLRLNPTKDVTTHSADDWDTMITGFEDHGIIGTKDEENNLCFYCHHCNVYMKKWQKVEKHCDLDFHQKNITKTMENILANPLNKNFILGQIQPNKRLESIGLTTETVLKMELNRIPPNKKHYYMKRGIRIKNPGENDAYWCKYCEHSISCLTNIESHISSDAHRTYEKRPTLSKFVSQSSEPVIGLEYITEYKCREFKDPMYECSLCRIFEDPYDMFIHICGFRHKLNLLKKLNPREMTLHSIRESPQAIKEINRRISELSTSMQIAANYKSAIPSKAKLDELKKFKTGGPVIEVIDITDDDVERIADLKKNLSIRVRNEKQAADATIVIQSLKGSVVKYYLNKIPAHLRRVLISKVIEKEVIDGNDRNNDSEFGLYKF